MIIRARFGGMCEECGRQIWEGDTIEWDELTKVTLHEQCAFGEDPPDRPVGSDAEVKPLKLPNYEDEDSTFIPWEKYVPKERY